MRVILRVASGLLVLIGVLPIVDEVVRHVLRGDLVQSLQRPVHNYIWEWSWLITMLLPVGAIWLFEKRIVRLLVPYPKPECPDCGHSLRHLRAPRCPECGAVVPASLVDRPAAGEQQRAE